MATVTRKFKANFLTFAAHRVATGQWSDDDVAELQEKAQVLLAGLLEHEGA